MGSTHGMKKLHSTLDGMKKLIRAEVKVRVKALPPATIDAASDLLMERLNSNKFYQESGAISCYLSMKQEVATASIIKECFAAKKRVFIPKVMGKKSEEMFMFELESNKQISSFPMNNWGIPEPPIELLASATDGLYGGVIDVILVPGVAFSRDCQRVGHGKGYYGRYIVGIQ